jgi:hypothetical protein
MNSPPQARNRPMVAQTHFSIALSIVDSEQFFLIGLNIYEKSSHFSGHQMAGQ